MHYKQFSRVNVIYFMSRKLGSSVQGPKEYFEKIVSIVAFLHFLHLISDQNVYESLFFNSITP